MRGTKRLNPFFRLHEANEVLSFSPGLFLVVVYMGIRTGPTRRVTRGTSYPQWRFKN